MHGENSVCASHAYYCLIKKVKMRCIFTYFSSARSGEFSRHRCETLKSAYKMYFMAQPKPVMAAPAVLKKVVMFGLLACLPGQYAACVDAAFTWRRDLLMVQG